MEQSSKQLKFDIVTADKDREMKLTKKQVVVLLEALWDFKESVQAVNVGEASEVIHHKGKNICTSCLKELKEK
ncbi:hypothetical protein Z959_08480 [Clostridium novyi B str. ATCC 27606]|uniref:Uncharacterized protein n=1 Tax=Clostridium novyi B str. ATCC 27606 TaxID=1443123 RepID=A0AA40IUM9_CLONO|nr:hypothetical protein [Clostridium novyi]KEI16859.1 hypothetical protein Z959_08480 [Clostridium novyi B str. ATCC 27606]